jgi:hypothetical protein
MEVDREALTGVEELQQQSGVLPEPLPVRRLEERLRIAREQVEQRCSVGEPRQTELIVAVHGSGGGGPVLRRVISRGRQAAEGGNRDPPL